MVTIVLLVSRSDYLERVITAIELLNCEPKETNILCIVDGDEALYVKARNLIAGTKFENRLTVTSDNQGRPPQIDIEARRQRIAAGHNLARSIITEKTQYIFSIEDDTLVPRNALQKLLRVATMNRACAYAEGVELGRWGTPYVGAWLADDIYNPKKLTSVENINPVPSEQKETPIDAGGLYCALMRADLYRTHEFTSANGLGPDINFGIECRQLGFQNYIVWNVPCEHLFKKINTQHSLTPKSDSKIVTLNKRSDTKWVASS